MRRIDRLCMRLIVLAALLCAGCTEQPGPSGHGHEHGAPEAGFERGPHRGRLLRSGDFAIEVTIYETGVPPQFRLYAYHADTPLPAGDVRATVELGRLDGGIDRFAFVPDGDYLKGDGTVREPHSFDVRVSASHGGREYQWEYESYEGRITLPAAIAEAAGIGTARTGPGRIHEQLRVAGRVELDRDRQADIRAPFPGVLRAVRVAEGEEVRAGQVLALIENSTTLGTYELRAPLGGTVLERRTNIGDVAGADPLFRIADLSSVWLDLFLFGDAGTRVRSGMEVRLRTLSGEERTAAIARVLPRVERGSQGVVARAILPNPSGDLRPGSAVEAVITLSQRDVPLVVHPDAVQRFRDFDVVFARYGDTYEVRMLELGAEDGEAVEVLGGIEPGVEYVVRQSFLIKADIEKAGASHDH